MNIVVVVALVINASVVSHAVQLAHAPVNRVAKGARIRLASARGSSFHRRDSPVDVKSRGAIGDGAADDSDAFAKSLADAKATNSAIYVPAGQYRVTRPLTGFSDFTLYGDGPKSEIIFDHEQEPDLKAWTWNHSLFNFSDGDHNINFHDIKLRYKGTFSVGGTKESYQGRIAGIYLPKVRDVKIEKADISGFNSYGIHQTTADKSKYATNIQVTKCRLHDNRVSGFRFDFVDGCTILDCDLYRNGHPDDPGTGYGIAGSSGGRPKNVMVKNCRAYNNKRVGIDFHVGDNVTIENNEITGSRDNGIGNQNGIYVAETFGTLRIVGNHLHTFRDRGETRAYIVDGIRIGYPYTGGRRNTERVSIILRDNTIDDFDVIGGQQIGYPIFFDNTFADADVSITGNNIDSEGCFALISMNDHPGHVEKCEITISDNRLAAQKIVYVPIRVANATTARFENNTVQIGSSESRGQAVFTVAAPGSASATVHCFGNRISVPDHWDKRALLPPGFSHTGAGNTINGSNAD